MHIDARRLRFLLAVARSGGMLAAASDLRVTPSAVSQQISRLESEVGKSLVHRSPHGAVLTADGLALVQAAEDIERTLNEAVATLSASDDDPAGTVRVGGFHSFLLAVVIPSLADWRVRYPNLRIEVVESDTDELMRDLRSGATDLAIVELDAGENTPALPGRMTETPLLDEPWKLVVPKGALASTETIDFGRLSLPWLGFDDEGASAQAVKRVRRAFGGSETEVHRYLETPTALAMVAAGEGMTVLPSLALEGFSLQGVDALEVPGLGTRRVVLRRYERRSTPDVFHLAAGLIREAAGGFAFGQSVDGA
jgi:molybdate transport repressor ModE-like protein